MLQVTINTKPQSLVQIHKQPPEVFCKKGVLRNLPKFTGKHLSQRPATLFKKRLWHRCFPVNFAKFLRTPFFTEHLRCLLLQIRTFFKKAKSTLLKSTYFHFKRKPNKCKYFLKKDWDKF